VQGATSLFQKSLIPDSDNVSTLGTTARRWIPPLYDTKSIHVGGPKVKFFFREKRK
jgi:hypothetical protein